MSHNIHWVQFRIESLIMSPDTHVSLTTIFSLPKGKTAKDYMDKLYARAKVANKSIYYGIATNENKLMCREGYENAEDFLVYMKEIVSCQLGDEVTILVSGPGLELDKIKPKLTASIQAEITFAELNNDNMLLGRLPKSTSDTHVTVLPEITVPQGRMTEFKSVMEKFCSAAKNGTTGCLYYGFAVAGDMVWCREGYTGAEGVLEHLTEVKQPHEEGLLILGEAGLKVHIIGPASELEKLRPAMAPMGAIFWELDNMAYWK